MTHGCSGALVEIVKQLTMTEVTQTRRVVVDLVVCTLVGLAVADLELQQKHDVAVENHGVNALSHAGNYVLENDPAVRKCAQLSLENHNLRFPRVALLNCRLRRDIIGMDDVENLLVTLPQKIRYRGRIVGSQVAHGFTLLYGIKLTIPNEPW